MTTKAELILAKPFEFDPTNGFKYFYEATVVEAYDGDTLTAEVDLGFYVWKVREKFRLFGLDAPEIRGVERPEGLLAKAWFHEKVLGKKVVIESIKDKQGKYGRYLAIVWLDGENVNRAMVEAGHAHYQDY